MKKLTLTLLILLGAFSVKAQQMNLEETSFALESQAVHEIQKNAETYYVVYTTVSVHPIRRTHLISTCL